MPDIAPLLEHWGYLAIFLIVALGNVSVPVPEETVLILAGYLVWRGELQFPMVLAVGIVSAVIGDNVGYWIGRGYGKDILDRIRRLTHVSPERFNRMQRFVMRYGLLAVFLARFIAGLRFAAGPLAGALGVRVRSFVVGNVLGALVFVPLAVSAGYAMGLGFGRYVEHGRRIVGEAGYTLLGCIALVVSVFVAVRIRRAFRGTGSS